MNNNMKYPYAEPISPFSEPTSPFRKISKEPKCARCRNHGVINILKGHKHSCEFRYCKCVDCLDVYEKQKITAKRVATLRKEQRDKLDRDRKSKLLELQHYIYYKSYPNNLTPLEPMKKVYKDRNIDEESYIIAYDIKWLIKSFPGINQETLTYFLCKSGGILPVAVQYAMLYKKNAYPMKDR